ncbi:MAG: hypothetical protein GX621_03700, partial [Pirellulaceae bacterium]|nr:hypothetical protein [Pirellulaceae bacterium]
MESPVERLLEFHSVRSFGSRERLLESQEEARGLYRSLAFDDVQQLVGIAIESVSDDDAELAENIFRNLACLKPGSLLPFHDQLIDRHLYCPGVMYHGATADTANRILGCLSSTNFDDALPLNQILCALAWIGNETVQRAFDSWRHDPPGWADSLYIPVEAYAQIAGWELMPDGGRRDLFLRECHPLVKPDDENCLPGVLEIATRHEGSCPWCKHGMTTLLDLNLSRPELEFLHLDGDRLQ